MFVPRSIDVDENDFFDIYRRVQVISQPITLFYTNHYPPQQLELFCQFVQLFTDSKPADVLPYIREMRRLRIYIKEHLKNSLAMPPFSSFSRIKQWQREVAEEASRLREDVDSLFITICDDNESSSRLIDYLTRSKLKLNESPFSLSRMVKRFETDTYLLKTYVRRSSQYRPYILLRPSCALFKEGKTRCRKRRTRWLLN